MSDLTRMRRDIRNLALPLLANRKRLLAASIMLLAVALFGLAVRAKTSHYAPQPNSAAYFSSSVKIAEKAHTLRTILGTPVAAHTGYSPVVATCQTAVIVAPVAGFPSEPLGGLRPLRAPPASFSSLL